MAWRQANPERLREVHRSWEKANPERKREYNRTYKTANPDKAREHVRRRQALLKAAPGGAFDPRRPDYLPRYALWKGWCSYCLAVPYEEVDHEVPLSRGGTNDPTNIRPACRSCNASKKDALLWDEWIPPAYLGANDLAQLLFLGAWSKRKPLSQYRLEKILGVIGCDLAVETGQT